MTPPLLSIPLHLQINNDLPEFHTKSRRHENQPDLEGMNPIQDIAHAETRSSRSAETIQRWETALKHARNTQTSCHKSLRSAQKGTGKFTQLEFKQKVMGLCSFPTIISLG